MKFFRVLFQIHLLVIVVSLFLLLIAGLVFLVSYRFLAFYPFLLFLLLIIFGLFVSRLYWGPSILLALRFEGKGDSDRMICFWADGIPVEVTLKKGHHVWQHIFYPLRRSRETLVTIDRSGLSDNVEVFFDGKKNEDFSTTIDTLNHNHRTVECVISEKNDKT